MGAVEVPFEEIPNIFDTGGAKGLLVDMVEKIPKFTITGNESADTSGDGVSCSVCLQVLLMQCSNTIDSILSTSIMKRCSFFSFSGFLMYRISNLERLYVACHIATTCFICLASILGW